MDVETERLHIRSVIAEDWRSFRTIWEDEKRSPYGCYDTPHIAEDTVLQARVGKWAQCVGSMEHLFFAVCLDGKMIGYVAFNQREKGHEIGYCFHSAYHGKGYARESLLALLDKLKAAGIERFIVRTAMENLPSVHLMEALGFRLVGREKVSFCQDADGNDIVFDGGIFERTM